MHALHVVVPSLLAVSNVNIIGAAASLVSSTCPPNTATVVSGTSYVQTRQYEDLPNNDPVLATRPDGSLLPSKPLGEVWDPGVQLWVFTQDDASDWFGDAAVRGSDGPAPRSMNAEVQLHVSAPRNASSGAAGTSSASNSNASLWYEIRTSYLLEKGQPTGAWSRSTCATGSSVTGTGKCDEEGNDLAFPSNALFHCEYVEFTYSYVDNTDDGAEGGDVGEEAGTASMRDLMLAISSRSNNNQDHSLDGGGDICSRPIYNPCDHRPDGGDDTVCSAMNGKVSCIQPENGMLSPIKGLTRKTYLDLYHCIDYPPPRQQEVGTPESSSAEPIDLYWLGRYAFLQATNVTAALSDGGALFYTFDDMYDRQEVINSGGEGEEISREDYWTETIVSSEGEYVEVDRRLKFYFWPNSTIGPEGYPEFPWSDRAKEDGWVLHEARMYDNGNPALGSSQDEDDNASDRDRDTNADGRDRIDGYRPDPEWISWTGYDGVSQIGVPTGFDLFYCDYVEFNFYSGWMSQGGGSDPDGRFVGHDMFIGAFLPNSYRRDVCSLMVYNPCSDNGERSYCRAVDGIVACIEPELATNDTDAPAMTQRSSIGSSQHPHCQIPGGSPHETQPGDADSVTAEDLPAVPLRWEGKYSFLYSKESSMTFSDISLSFEDQDNRPQCLASGGRGEEISRYSYWYEGNIRRGIGFSFAVLPPHINVTSFAADEDASAFEKHETIAVSEEAEAAAEMPPEEAWEYEAFEGTSQNENQHENDIDMADGDLTAPQPFDTSNGWVMYRTDTPANQFPYDNTLVWEARKERSMIRTPSDMHLFHCEYMEFKYKSPYGSRPIEGAKFVGQDVVLGAFLQEGYDICDLQLYNPCHGAGKVCSAVNGIVTCLEAMEDGLPTLTGRSAAPDIFASCEDEAEADSIHILDTMVEKQSDPASSATCLLSRDAALISGAVLFCMLLL